MNEQILTHLRSIPGTWQTGREVAAALGLAAGASRPVIEVFHVMAEAGTGGGMTRRRKPAPWSPISLTHPMRHLRALARGASADGQPLLSQSDAAALLGLPPTPGSVSTVSTAELRGPAIQLQRLLARAEAYGVELEVRVRRR